MKTFFLRECPCMSIKARISSFSVSGSSLAFFLFSSDGPNIRSLASYLMAQTAGWSLKSGLLYRRLRSLPDMLVR